MANTRRQYTAADIAAGMPEIDALECIHADCADCPYCDADGDCVYNCDDMPPSDRA